MPVRTESQSERNKGADPTRLSTSAGVQYKYTDFESGFSNELFEGFYLTPIGMAERTAVGFRVPFYCSQHGLERPRTYARSLGPSARQRGSRTVSSKTPLVAKPPRKLLQKSFQQTCRGSILMSRETNLEDELPRVIKCSFWANSGVFDVNSILHINTCSV